MMLMTTGETKYGKKITDWETRLKNAAADLVQHDRERDAGGERRGRGTAMLRNSVLTQDPRRVAGAEEVAEVLQAVPRAAEDALADVELLERDHQAGHRRVAEHQEEHDRRQLPACSATGCPAASPTAGRHWIGYSSRDPLGSDRKRFPVPGT